MIRTTILLLCLLTLQQGDRGKKDLEAMQGDWASERFVSSGTTLDELFVDLDSRHPGLRERLVENGQLRRFVNVYLNDEDVRFLGGLETALADGDDVTILPAVAGG